MSSRLNIPNEVKSKISAWNLPRGILVQVYTHLHAELATEPASHLVEIVAPVHVYEYQFQVADAQTDYHVSVYLEFNPSMNPLNIIDIYLSRRPKQ